MSRVATFLLAGVLLGLSTAEADAQGTATVYVWPVGSGKLLSYNISVGKDGTWQAVIAKLLPGVEYNVSVQGSVSSGQKAFSVATDPAVAKAAK